MSLDSETARLIDRIQATAFYQAKLALIKDKSPGAWAKSGRNREMNLGEIVKDRVERLMLLEQGSGRYSKETLRKIWIRSC